MDRMLVVLVTILALSCSNISLPLVRVESQSVQKVDGKDALRIAGGTGFFVSKTGVIVTAAHVIEESKKIYIYHQGRNIARRALLLHRDEYADVAVLYVSGVHVDKPLHFCEDMSVGEPVSAWAWRSYGTERTRGPIMSRLFGGVWAIGTIVGLGFSGGPAYVDGRKCVAGVVIQSNMSASQPLAIIVRPEASAGVLKVLRDVAPDSVRGL